MTAPVVVRGLEAGYGETPVLVDVSFHVDEGEIFFVAGGNGTGKSTLLRAMLGLLEPRAGDVELLGRSLADAADDERRALLARVGMLYQGGALFSAMTVEENVALPLELLTDLPRAERRELAALKLAQVGLEGAGPRMPSELSGGMRRRAALARALVLDPPLLLLDEPHAGLDPVTAREMDGLVRRTRDRLGTTILIVSHDLPSLLGIGDRMILLLRGEPGVAAEGAPRELARSADDPRVRCFLNDGLPVEAAS